MSPEDESLLEKFFSYGRADKSPMGPMLDRAELYSRQFQEPHAGKIDVRPRLSSQSSSNVSGPDDVEVYILGHVSRRLSVVRKFNPRANLVLAAFYGDIGAKWGRRAEGRLVSIIILTDAGRKMLKRESKKTHIEMSADLQVENAVGSKDISTKSLFDVAMRQARGLYDEACSAWDSTAPREVV